MCGGDINSFDQWSVELGKVLLLANLFQAQLSASCKSVQGLIQ
jgi:glucose-6-phosphate isomerase